MKDFFNIIKVNDFFSILKRHPVLDSVETELGEAGGSFSSVDIFAPEDLPATDRSSMDGYAVRFKDTFGAGDSNPAYLELCENIGINAVSLHELKPGHCAGIVTGATLPPGADSVVMVEYAHDMGEGSIEIRRPVAPWENVMLKGEDIKSGEQVLGAGEQISYRKMGLLAALGIEKLSVYQRPAVGVISTGDELVEISMRPLPGCIRDINSLALGQLLRENGCNPTIYQIVPDSESLLEASLRRALKENDVVLISGGSSVGNRDYTVSAMNAVPELEILVHGVAISPGKPTIFAARGNKCVWGLPGQAGSAQVVMLALVIPFLKHLQGDPDPFNPREELMVRASLSRNIASKYGREDHIRVRLEKSNGQVFAVPVTGKSGLLKTLLKADGLIKIPDNCEGLSENDEVLVRLF
ncbi:molybdopterin molybdotransferase MoeA [Desulfonatronovibrio magnus]|uniref:molybdopterin molybdotransferase MoeA n=1 Tax=Desulfonatronovibrio magnus TaxID=698827 RepID=UPI0005EBB0D4|nr:gephyrin-like molybdotransferase Glp [Desulfonatronovibrio magnus]